LGHFAPLSFSAYGGKIQATRCAGGRWLKGQVKMIKFTPVMLTNGRKTAIYNLIIRHLNAKII
jgi:hypothetical protein